jgi:hypothetical protein
MIEVIDIEKFTVLPGQRRIALDREELGFLYRKFSYLAGKEELNGQKFAYYTGVADALATILKLFNTR